MFLGSFIATFALVLVGMEALFGGTVLHYVSSHLVVVVMLQAPSHAAVAWNAQRARQIGDSGDLG